MGGLIEFNGRITRAEGRATPAARADLLFQLHSTLADDDVLWAETLRGVEVAGGGFAVVLGQDVPIEASYFEDGPRWLSVRLVKGGKPGEEVAARAPLAGNDLRLEARIEALEGRAAGLGEEDIDAPVGGMDRLPNRVQRLKDTVEQIDARLVNVEESDVISSVGRRVELLIARLESVEGEDGRLQRLEDEMEDLVGPDGDVVDLNERMDRIEGRAPELIASLRNREPPVSQEKLDELRRETEALRAVLSVAEATLAELKSGVAELREQPAATPDGIGAVKRAGDVMTGGLIINRGGLEVLSGGVTCRGATVTTLEASNLVKSPKTITDAIELRGDLTVDNTRRVLQVRMIEGRQGSARKDGALHLNSRGGAEVVIGNAEEARGAQVFGTVAAEAFQANLSAVAQVFELAGEASSGDVLRLTEDGRKVTRANEVGDRRVVGVLTDKPALLLGGALSASRVAVAVQGEVITKVEADSSPIHPGDLLGPSAIIGHACKVTDPAASIGAIIGKALEPLESGRGTMRMLVWSR